MRQTVHLVANAHIDPVWLWEWPEGAATAVSTFRTAADLCEAFPDFIFNHNEALVYRWVEEYEPALFERIRRLVKAGRWRIIGGWHLQPDCNMPSGESFVRQALTGKRYFQDRFGVDVRVAANFDPFGHTRGLAQILARAGYDAYVFWRPGPEDCPLPGSEFRWVGYDGSEILAVRAESGYGSRLGGARAKVERWMADHPDRETLLVLWGVGDHGGGPSRKDLQDLAALAQASPAVIRHSTAEAYIADRVVDRAALPRHTGAMNPWAVGCYTSMVRVKQAHRSLENAIYSAEKMAVHAAGAGRMGYPKAELAQALYDLLTSEFHDSLPGSSIEPVEEGILRWLGHGREIADRVRTRAFFALAAGQPPPAGDAVPVLVHNPHPFRVRAVVECEMQLADQNWSGAFAMPRVFSGRTALPAQVEREESNIAIDWRKRVVFQADLAPGQMNRFNCRFDLIPTRPRRALRPRGNRIVFRTADLAVVINTRTGLVDRYRAGGRDLVGKGAFRPIVMMDDADPWGMRVHGFRRVAWRFRLASKAAGTRFSGLSGKPVGSVRVVEDGDARSVVEAIFVWGRSFVCQRYKLPKAGTEIEIETRVHWNEKDRMLKLAIPLARPAERFLGQVAYGVEAFPVTGDEMVAQKWVAAVADAEDVALTVINDGLYGSDCDGRELRLSLLRSPAYSAHPIQDRPLVPPDRFTPRMDQGERAFRLWVNGGPAADRLTRIDREALARNEAPYVLAFFPPGEGVRPKPLATLSDAACQVTALKRAEDGDDLIVRLFNPTDRRRTTTLALPVVGVRHKATLGPFEIRTLRLDAKRRAVTEVDLLERDL